MFFIFFSILQQLYVWKSKLHSLYNNNEKIKNTHKHIYIQQEKKKIMQTIRMYYTERHAAFQKALILLRDIKRTLNNSDYYLKAQFVLFFLSLLIVICLFGWNWIRQVGFAFQGHRPWLQFFCCCSIAAFPKLITSFAIV